MLKEVGAIISEIVRETDFAARYGGDEFLVLTADHPTIDTAKAVALAIAKRLREELAKPFAVEKLQLKISASIGVAIYPEHADASGDLLRCADHAMYEAKLKGRNCIVVSNCETVLADSNLEQR